MSIVKNAWAKAKAWAVPLTRTFLAGAGTALVAEVADVKSFDELGIVLVGAATAGVNAVILVIQRLLPAVPNPEPPAA